MIEIISGVRFQYFFGHEMHMQILLAAGFRLIAYSELNMDDIVEYLSDTFVCFQHLE